MSSEHVQETLRLRERRLLLKLLLQIGLVGGAGLETLTSCSSSSQSPVKVNWLTNGDNNDTFSSLANYFTRINQDGIIIRPISGTDHDTLVKKFQNEDNTFDLVSLDISWMTEFIRKGWLYALDDYWHASGEQLKLTDYLDTPLHICSWHGQLWAAPLHTDVGVLYYRTDSPKNFIVSSSVDSWTWGDLEGMAQQAQADQWCSGGFLWEASWTTGSDQEGLMCVFLEILDGFGGQLFDNVDNPQRVLIESAEAINALRHMKTWNTTISAYTTEKGQAKKATDSSGSDCGIVWKEGHAAFMRNWPAYIAVSDNANNPIAGNYSIAALPRLAPTASGNGNSERHTRSCLGGWQLAINTYSALDKKNAAWQFIKWMLGPVAQQYLAYNEGFAVTLKSVYNDPTINKLNPHYKQLLGIVNNAQIRPLLPNYLNAVAIPVQAIVSRVLIDDGYTPEQAVLELKQKLQIALNER